MWLLYNINGLLVTNTLHILTVAYHLRGFTHQHSLLSIFLDETVCDLFKDCRVILRKLWTVVDVSVVMV